MSQISSQYIPQDRYLSQKKAACFARPKLSYASLIAEAIGSSTHGRMFLSEIYEYIIQHYDHYRYADGGWKNSVRHALSASPNFTKIAAGKTENKRKYEWGLHHSSNFHSSATKRSREKHLEIDPQFSRHPLSLPLTPLSTTPCCLSVPSLPLAAVIALGPGPPPAVLRESPVSTTISCAPVAPSPSQSISERFLGLAPNPDLNLVTLPQFTVQKSVGVQTEALSPALPSEPLPTADPLSDYLSLPPILIPECLTASPADVDLFGYGEWFSLSPFPEVLKQNIL